MKDRDGVERLIPNEVINWSFSDRNVRLKVPVSISYDNDPEQVLALLREATRANPRVLSDPEPGLANVRSDINLAIWRAFKDAGIVIPCPQRPAHPRRTGGVNAGGAGRCLKSTY